MLERLVILSTCVPVVIIDVREVSDLSAWIQVAIIDVREVNDFKCLDSIYHHGY